MRSVCKGLVAKDRLFRNVKKPVRTISGVVPIAVMTRPAPCPGKCIYCPGGLQLSTPKSYMPDSPVVLRAVPVNYDPYLQVVKRVKSYIYMGHRVSKVEIIVMGGTFTALPLEYQRWFIANIYKALNDYPVWEQKSSDNVNLEVEMKRNEKAKIRVVVLNIETRPDYINEKIIDNLLDMGVTRVEIGVQSIYDDVLRIVKRGHTVKEVIEATRMLKDSAFKVCYHIMPGLPGSDPDRDLEMLKTIFEDPNFRPDCLKIYPTLVIPGTELYEMWKRGEYRSYDQETWIELLSKMLSIVPRWVRVMRFGRDIPLHWVVDGPKIGNLRQVVLDYMSSRGMMCVEIRCREAGHRMLERGEMLNPDKIYIRKTVYEASGGIEIFLEAVDSEDTLYGILRLRIPSDNAHRPEIKIGRAALVRELHVYSPQVPISMRDEKSWQHRGIGRRLLAEAERIAYEEFSRYRMFIISAVGVREYYRKLGYRKYPGSFYMFKDLRKNMINLETSEIDEEYFESPP